MRPRIWRSIRLLYAAGGQGGGLEPGGIGVAAFWQAERVGVQMLVRGGRLAGVGR